MTENILSEFTDFIKKSEMSLAPAPAPQATTPISGISAPRANVHNALADTAPKSVAQAAPPPLKTSNAPFKKITFSGK